MWKGTTFCGEQEIINLGLTKGRGYDILYIVTLYHTKIQKVTEIRDFSRKALSRHMPGHLFKKNFRQVGDRKCFTE